MQKAEWNSGKYNLYYNNNFYHLWTIMSSSHYTFPIPFLFLLTNLQCFLQSILHDKNSVGK